MNEFEDIDRELEAAFTERPSVLSRPSLRDVKHRARRHQRQRSAGVLGACAVVGVGGAAVLATRSPANQTALGDGDPTVSTICFPTVSTSIMYDTTTVMYDSSTSPLNTIPATTGPATSPTMPDAVLTYYVVREGDNPLAIANMFGVTLEKLSAANHLTPGYDVFAVGTVIAIPISGNPGTYTLQAGDFPGLLAERFKITVAELDAANVGVAGYGGFILGTVINIPLPSQSSATTTTTTTPAEPTGTAVPVTVIPDTTVFPEPTAWTTTTLDVGILTVYHVQQGDTPEAVANAFGITVAQLDVANLGRSGYVEWLVDTSIIIPLPNSPATTAPDAGPYETLPLTECFPVSVSPTTSMPDETSTTIIGDTALNTAPPSTIPSFTKIGTTIQVINCSNQEGSAGYLMVALATEGFTMAGAETGTIDLPVTKVLYNPDDPMAYQVALTVSVYLGNVLVEPSGPIVPSETGTWLAGSGVIVLVGNDLAGKTLAQIATEAGTYTGPTNVPTSTTA